VRHPGRDDHDVARTDLVALLAGLERDLSFDDDPGFVVGVAVQPRAVPGVAVVEDQADGRSVIGAVDLTGFNRVRGDDGHDSLAPRRVSFVDCFGD
jgi:hypothetical protein